METMETIRYFLGTDSDILFCPLPKILGLEVAVVNAFSPGDTVVIPVFGETGECWASIAEAFGLSVIRLGGYGGEAPSPEDLRLLFWTRERGIQGVLVPHVEGTTGLWVDLAGFGEVCRSFGVLCVAEVGESFGIFPFELDRTGVDFVVVAEPLLFQGGTFLVIGERAWEARGRARCPRYALDFSRIREWSKGEVPRSFVERLEVLRAIGKEALWERRKHLAELFRKKVQALGFQIPQEELFPSVSIVELYGATKSEEVLSLLREQGIRAGRAFRKEKALWVRHGDTLEEFEIESILEVFQKSLREAGVNGS